MHMNATPEQVWALVSDVTQIGRYSPETFEGEWLDGATGPAVGARFRGHVKRNQKGPTYWAKCFVTASEPGREFSFGVGEPGKAAINWGYRLVPGANGGRSIIDEINSENTYERGLAMTRREVIRRTTTKSNDSIAIVLRKRCSEDSSPDASAGRRTL